MFLQNLKAQGFRCFDDLSLAFENKINLIHGVNGSGKTSLLEAIHCLSTGKSFRSRNTHQLIKHGDQEMVLFTRFAEEKGGLGQDLGFSYNLKREKNIRLNQTRIAQQSQVVQCLPVVTIDPEAYLFVDKPPMFRRSFLDWLVFHVKPQYLSAWQQTLRCQKQLGVIYKSKDETVLSYWEQQYANHATAMHKMRVSVFEQFHELFNLKAAKHLPPNLSLEVQLKQGWSDERGLYDQVVSDRERNFRFGVLSSGVHKADITIKTDSYAAAEVLSRGQKKMTAVLFYLSHIDLLQTITGKSPVLCVDDLDSELDNHNTEILMDYINERQGQSFITTVDTRKIDQYLSMSSVFHVKHGVVNSEV